MIEQEAVLNALQEATFQICGIRIQSTTETGALLIEDDSGTTMVERVNRQIKVRGKDPNADSTVTTSSRSSTMASRHKHRCASGIRCTRCPGRP